MSRRSIAPAVLVVGALVLVACETVPTCPPAEHVQWHPDDTLAGHESVRALYGEMHIAWEEARCVERLADHAAAGDRRGALITNVLTGIGTLLTALGALIAAILAARRKPDASGATSGASTITTVAAVGTFLVAGLSAGGGIYNAAQGHDGAASAWLGRSEALFSVVRRARVAGFGLASDAHPDASAVSILQRMLAEREQLPLPSEPGDYLVVVSDARHTAEAVAGRELDGSAALQFPSLASTVQTSATTMATVETQDAPQP